MKMRPISVGVSRQFQLVEVEGQATQTFRVEQATVKEKLPNGKTLMQWMPVAIVVGDWEQGHTALYRAQAAFMETQAHGN